MAGGSRRTHAKARNGCRQCKTRHVKCDTRGPRCSNCEKRNVTCEYTDLFRDLWPSQPFSSSHASRVRDSSLVVLPSQPSTVPELPRHELELMHLWTISTHATVGRALTPELKHIWGITVPLIAQRWPCLMYSILAITSAHKAHLDPLQREKHLQETRRYHVQASTLFRPLLDFGINDDNSGPSLIFSILTMLTSLTLQQTKSEDGDLDKFVEWVLLTRRSVLFARTLGNTAGAAQGIAGLLPRSISHLKTPFTLDERLSASLNQLEATYLALLDASSFEYDVIRSSTAQTREWFTLVAPHPQDLNYIIRWIALLPDGYFELLRSKHSFALALLGHWIVPLQHAPRRWILGDWPERVAVALMDELGVEWRDTIRWVMIETNISSSKEGGIANIAFHLTAEAAS